MTRRFDLLTIGRSSIDLYANEPGPFNAIQSFGAFVGGCPTNIAVGTRRLGLKTALLTAVGDDAVGQFILNFLQTEEIETRWIPTKPGKRSSAVVLGIEPPDQFPLVFYRDNCADIELTIDDINDVPFEDFNAILLSGTGFSKEPSRSATLYAIEQAKQAGCQIYLDLDFRPDQWHDPRAYGITMRSILPTVDLVIGTEEEIKAAVLKDRQNLKIENGAISDARITGDSQTAIDTILKSGSEPLIVKKGAQGAEAHFKNGHVITADPFPVDVVNVLGAGDAFASGLIYGLAKQMGWQNAIRIGNATGAIVVTRQGCANFMPTEAEVQQFIADQVIANQAQESRIACPVS